MSTCSVFTTEKRKLSPHNNSVHPNKYITLFAVLAVVETVTIGLYLSVFNTYFASSKI